MAQFFRQTAFDPIDRQVFGESPPVDMAQMEAALAKEMARMKIAEAKKQREIEKIALESDEIKELKQKIEAARLNKERSAQITEKQFRVFQNIVSKLLFNLFLGK